MRDPTQPYLEAASVLGWFDPTTLSGVGVPRPEGISPALRLLSPYTTVDEQGSRWKLDPEPRKAVLNQLVVEGRLEEAQRANTQQPEALEYGEALRLLTTRHAGWKGDGSIAHLERLQEVQTWLDLEAMEKAKNASGPTAEQIDRELGIRRLLAPLERLVPANGFVGREEELSRLHDFVRSTPESGLGRVFRKLRATTREVHEEATDWNPTRPLCIWGAGGLGKSSLIAQFVLDTAAGDDTRFAYIDFDLDHHDILRPETIAATIFNQLEVQAPGIIGPEHRASLEKARRVAADDLLMSDAARGYETDRRSRSRETGSTELGRFVRASLASAGERSVVVFDTFEEAQQPHPHAMQNFFSFVEGMLASPNLPSNRAGEIRVILCGRAPIRNLAGDDHQLGPLPRTQGLALLSKLDVSDSRLAERIFERVGGNPLSLHLAAEVVRQTEQSMLQATGSDEPAWLAEIDGALVQGQLYDRILRTLPDMRVRRLAHPGLILRRITPELIRDVLQPLLPELAHEDARELFRLMGRYVSLVEQQPDGALWHRKDVRREMLPAMLREKKSAPLLGQIQQRAVEWYEGREGPRNLAEGAYHRLLLGDIPEYLSEEVLDHLRPALKEPLPPPSLAWLQKQLESQRMLSMTSSEEVKLAIEGAETLLAIDRPEEALKLLSRARVEAPKNPYILVLQAQALDGVGAGESAAAAAGEGIALAREQGNREALARLYEVAGQSAIRVGDEAGAISNLKLAASSHDDPQERFRVLLDAARALERTEYASEATAALGDAMLSTPAEKLFARPDLLRKAIRLLWLDSAAVRYLAPLLPLQPAQVDSLERALEPWGALVDEWARRLGVASTAQAVAEAAIRYAVAHLLLLELEDVAGPAPVAEVLASHQQQLAAEYSNHDFAE